MLTSLFLSLSLSLSVFPGCCFVTFYTRKAALEAQNALHNIKTLTGVSVCLSAHVCLSLKASEAENFLFKWRQFQVFNLVSFVRGCNSGKCVKLCWGDRLIVFFFCLESKSDFNEFMICAFWRREWCLLSWNQSPCSRNPDTNVHGRDLSCTLASKNLWSVRFFCINLFGKVINSFI